MIDRDLPHLLFTQAVRANSILINYFKIFADLMTTNYAPVFPFILFKSNHFHFHMEYDIIENDDLSVYDQVNMW